MERIPAEHIYRLTERFYRVNEDLSRQRQGTGLGLSIVKHILNRHQGELIIDRKLMKAVNLLFGFLKKKIKYKLSKMLKL